MRSVKTMKRMMGYGLFVFISAGGLSKGVAGTPDCFAQTTAESPKKCFRAVDCGPAPLVLAEKMATLTPAGWKMFEDVKRFTPENLYEQINGRAEFFLAYDMIQMTFASFMNNAKEDQFMDLSIYDMGTPTNAFGVFSNERSPGEDAVPLGRAGYRSGASFFIWKGRYYIRVIASEETEELKRIGMDVAEKTCGFLPDSGDSVWGIKALPRKNLVPGSLRYVKADAMGLSFMKDTYMAHYRMGKAVVTAFFSRQPTPESAEGLVSRYEEYAVKYGEGVERVVKEGVPLVTCDMGGGYDVIFWKGHLFGGVSSVDEQELAVETAMDLRRQLGSK